MNTHLQSLLQIIQQDERLTTEQKQAAIKSLKVVDKELEVTAFKLNRTEKVKQTTAILLEETIAELEQNRKSVEAQNRELEIEASLERVRARTMAMQKSDELAEVSQLMNKQLRQLGFKNDVAGFVMNYRESDDLEVWRSSPDQASLDKIHFPYFDHPLFRAFIEAKEKGVEFYTLRLTFEEKNKWIDYAVQHAPSISAEAKEVLYKGAGYAHSSVLLKNVGLFIENFDGIPFSKSENAIFIRFGKVFEQTYTRFLDLQKAEAQARESQIQLALERVRAKTMAMQSSGDLLGVANVLREQMGSLGQPDLESSIVHLYHDNSPMIEAWYAYRPPNLSSNEIKTGVGIVPKDCSAWSREVMAKYNSSETVYTIEASGEKIVEWYKMLEQYVAAVVDYDTNGQLVVPEILYYHFSKFSGGALLMISNQEPSGEARELQKRAAVVFGLAYTRFLDLQRAEAQARESQIQLTLERVRARTMAMHHSSELAEVALLLFDQLKQLGAELWTCGFAICEKENVMVEKWMASPLSGQLFDPIHVPYTADPREQGMYDAWRNGLDLYTFVQEGEELQKRYEHLMKVPYVNENVRKVMESGIPLPVWQKNYVVSYKYGYLLIIATKPFEETPVFIRFAKVFEQTYTRFLDLQKAEAQAREAHIEAALEKVRSRSLAMHKSEELQDVINTVFDRLKELDVVLNTTNILIFESVSRNTEYWTGSNSTGEFVTNGWHVPYADFSYFKDLQAARESGQEVFLGTYEYEEKNALFNHLFSNTDFKNLNEERKKFALESEGAAMLTALVKDVGIQIISYSRKSFSQEEIEIVKRFAKVFHQAYIRFLDLQKAEAQAREATIEAALEKVRGKAMAMHTSSDLSAAASMVFTELRKLGIRPIRCGVGLIKESRTEKVQLYSATTSPDGDNLALMGQLLMTSHPVLEKVYDAWLSKEDYFPVLEGEQLKLYYEALLSALSVPTIPNWQTGEKQYGHFILLSIGSLYAWSEKPYEETEIKIVKRFAAIIDLTFRRYIELQTSEANAREAVRRASLDRVRAEIASMRSTNDLERITPLMWSELTTLGVPFVRCGVFIMDEQQELIHTFLSTPDGRAFLSFHLPYTTPGRIGDILNHWKTNQNYINHWDEVAFTEFANLLIRQEVIPSKDQYMRTVPPGGIHLHCLPFLQGMLYVGNTALLKEDEVNLVQSLADAFSTAYARYEDFNKLESAKGQIEKTLVDLKQTQAQLVQSEKMASLGELTAGIAHEIQNPLNFVNNFSEVSNELIDEMMEEVKRGNFEDANALANDVKQNLEKILHHGKRADGIVKGMLQHSRTSSGVKESTNINALADEYLRLAYHGLRAKDKSFNAKFETEFDETVGNVNVVPQDIGRVVINLITNAFYTVAEKRKQQSNGLYDPTVTVSTKKNGGNVFISIKDNGNGIPPKALDKIFQPFFTTKPTGQGTGLGLSLSYDIVKAHGGELTVETKEGLGAEFIINLPIV